MSLSSALSIALSGLQASTTQMQITSNNIANAGTAGYTDKGATTTSTEFGTGEGGVIISGYTRSTNAALTTSLNNATTQASFTSTENSYLSQVQELLGSNSNNPALSTALANFQSAWTQFQEAPEDATQQQSVIEAGVNLATQVQSIASGVTNLQKNVTSDIATTVGNLNSDLSQVASLNEQIYAAQGVGQSTGDLEDERDEAINSVASITGVTVVTQSNGQVSLYTPGGTLLVDGNAVQTFTYNGTTITSQTGANVTNQLSGGSLQAEVNFLYGSGTSTDPGTGVINKLQSQVQTLVNSFTSTTDTTGFAASYNNATTTSGELASNFFTTDSAGDPASFGVNTALTTGTSTLKENSAAPVATALSATRSFSAQGLSISSGSYTDLGTTILSGFQQAANSVSTANASAAQQQSYYQTSLSSTTGVDVDSELVNLTTLQNSYAASAHVISTINAMLADLENVIS